MERLSPQQEKEIAAFGEELRGIDGPDDMFPPETGVREPLRPIRPAGSASEALRLQVVSGFAIDAALLLV